MVSEAGAPIRAGFTSKTQMNQTPKLNYLFGLGFGLGLGLGSAIGLSIASTIIHEGETT